MTPKVFTQKIPLQDGREIILETGKLAKQAHGSVVVRLGNAMLLATVVSSKEAKPDIDFLPLTVDYREKFAAAGLFPGGFFKREARPSDSEVLTMRLVDRVLRPLFPKDYHAEIQVMIQLMSHDDEVMPDALAGLAASTALMLSDIPFHGPISEARISRIDGQYTINPSRNQLAKSDMDIMVGASSDSVAMVEGEMDEISEQDLSEAIKEAHKAIKEQCDAQMALVAQVGAKTIREYAKEEEFPEIYDKINSFAYQQCYDLAKSNTAKAERTDKYKALKEETLAQFSEEDIETYKKQIGAYFNKVQKEAVRNLILEEGIRLDGRKTDEIRPIWSEVDYLPSPHGSSIFTRGETQALATVTLGTSRQVNVIDLPTEQSEERFYLHYNFPPFSTGEARPLRGTSRREVGHGNLAQRALKGMVPNDCPYTVRVVSEVLESNGSSSMATVCAGTLAMMDAGIQLIKPVSGIAMGLITDGNKHAVLSDILGDEDHLGDMDFKVTGTDKGITACQMDIKIKGLSYDIIEDALLQAKEGRIHILGKILETIDAPRESVKAHSPKMIRIDIPKDYIGAVIGPSGKNIQALQETTGTTVVIEEDGDKGIVEIMGTDQVGIDKAIESIGNTTFEFKEGEIYKGKVIKMLDFGAVLEFRPTKEILLHISELAWHRVENVTDEINMGDEVEVKYMGIDSKTRKQKISRRVLLERPPRKED